MTTIALYAPFSPGSQMVFVDRHLDRLSQMGSLIDARFVVDADETLDRIGEADVIVSTWGMPMLDSVRLACLPCLRGVFYAAGTVKGFVTPEMYARGIVVSSAAPMNAVPVAEYTIAVILLSNKCFWHVMRHDHSTLPPRDQVPGNYRRTVGLIGASMVGREVLRLLRGYDMHVLLADPFVSAEEAERLGAVKVELPDLMTQSDIVSLHAPNLPSLRHMINADLLARMKDGATFINTARGALVDEAALATELRSGRINAVLDVTDPEPPAADGPLMTLPNVIYTPHIAGSMGRECERMADFAIDELQRFLAGEPLHNAIPASALANLA